MKRLIFGIILASIMVLIVTVTRQVVIGQAQVTAEAVISANLRSMPGVDGSEIIGEIFNGTAYPVIGRSEFFPWLLVGDPVTGNPIGWVYQDIVTVTGNIFSVSVSTLEVTPDMLIQPTATPMVDMNIPVITMPPSGGDTQGGNVDGALPTATLEGGIQITPLAQTTEVLPLPSNTPTATPFVGVIGTTQAEINVRYGPGTDYSPLARAFAGHQFVITGYHTQFPWVQVVFEDSPNGFAWIAIDLLVIEGNVYSTTPISTTNFNLIPLTPTPAMNASSNIPGQAPVELRQEIMDLGNSLWDFIMSRNFILESRRFGALYFQDLQTGEAFTYGNNIAFSGTSLTKIAILLAYFGVTDISPDLAASRDIANTMICSENVATNRLLSVIGGGDALTGAENTTQLLRELGMTRTFITAPYDTTTPLATSTPPPRAAQIPRTDADQTRANPNITNQMTVDEMGWLLANIYQCAYNESGPLIDNFDGRFTPQECRKIMYVMSENTVDGLLKAGAPEEIRVAHKHGWVPDTHGNAAVFFTPGGDYVITMMLHEPTFLNFVTDSLPTLAHTSMRVYNYYNPDNPLSEPREGYIPEAGMCNYTTTDPIVTNLSASMFLYDNDASLYYNQHTGGMAELESVTPLATVDPMFNKGN
jgi:beta-lactamase class A/uncharacterized protein YraI